MNHGEPDQTERIDSPQPATPKPAAKPEPQVTPEPAATPELPEPASTSEPAVTPEPAVAPEPAPAGTPPVASFARWIGATTAQLTVTGVCLALLLAAIGYRVVADDGQDPVPAATRAAPPDERAYTVPRDSPGDGGKVRVVEKGYSPINDGRLVSYGAILENTSRKMAAVGTLSLRIADIKGRSLVGRYADYALTKKVIILPGQRTGVSDCVYVERPAVASVTITVDEVGWIKVDPKRRYAASLTAKVLKTDMEKDQGGDELVVSFEVASAYSTLLRDPDLSMVFRDAKGAIVGGSHQHSLDGYSEFPPGTSRHVTRVKYGPPPGIDPSKIELYPYPG